MATHLISNNCKEMMLPEEVRAATDMIMHKELGRLFLSKLFQGISPQKIAHQAMCWWLPEAVDLAQVVKSVELGRKTSVNAQELLVHDRSQGQRAE